jgi:ABC-2 type transport system ATP-binding protein
MTLAISTESVVKRFGAVTAVNEVTFEAREGEVTGLLGPNGAGKSTLIRMIVGVLAPDAGTIRVPGGRPRLAHPDLGYLPEERGLYLRERVDRLLEFFASLRGLHPLAARRAAREALERLGVADLAARRVQTLSKGNQQKIQIAAALVHTPRVALLDEPFSGLDPLNRRVIVELVREIAASGGAVVLSTHQMDQVEALCDRLWFVRDGRVILSGGVSELRERFFDGIVEVDADGDVEIDGSRLEYRGGSAGSGAGHGGNGAATGLTDRSGSSGKMRRVRLAPDTPPERYLARLAASGAAIRHFERRLPTVEEIFIHAVTDTRIAGNAVAAPEGDALHA